jgi:hypothetical protein
MTATTESPEARLYAAGFIRQHELDWVFLHEHPEILRRHWEMAWREGRV